MTNIIKSGIIILLFCGFGMVQAEDSGIRSAVVKVYTSSASADYFTPWQLLNTQSSTGSGVILSGRRILTNAHVIADSQFVQLQKNGSSRRYKAEVGFISHEADLALLTIADDKFWEGTTSIELGELPETLTSVSTYGYPIGGSTLSITRGILSRIEHNYYAHSDSWLLTGQIDAAINPGNSGGPVIADGKIVGLVMQSVSSARTENLGYMIPSPLIEHFLTDVKDGQYDGFPDLGFVAQSMENPSMRAYYGLKDNGNGVVISHVFLHSPAADKLQKNDVLLAINGISIASDQTITFRKNERTHYHYLVDSAQVGDTLTLTIYRDGKQKKIDLIAGNNSDKYRLVDGIKYGEQPRYFIYAGVVFVPLTANLMSRWGDNWKFDAPLSFLTLYRNWAVDEKQEVVVALKVLPDDVNVGYHDWRQWIVTEVNGEPIKSFSNFYQAIKNNTEDFIVLNDDKGYQMIFDNKKALARQDIILANYRIPSATSEDLK